MSRLIISAVALSDIDRCRRFLSAKSPQASLRAMQAIRKGLTALMTVPEAGRPSERLVGYRELIIAFGDSGYVARYMFDIADDAVHVVALWHQREAGF